MALITMNNKPVPFPLNILVALLVLPFLVCVFGLVIAIFLGVMVALTAPVWIPVAIIISLLAH